MRINFYPKPTLPRKLLAGGALASTLFLGGCSISGDADSATNKFASSVGVSETCVNNIRAKLDGRDRDGSFDTATQIEIDRETCPTEDQNNVFKVASMVIDENTVTDERIKLIGFGGVFALVIGGAGVAVRNIYRDDS